MKRVIIESPFAGDIARNTEYARRCLKDSLDRGEAPFASHLLYPQVLDENDPEQRKRGIDAGFAWWGGNIEFVALYIDYNGGEFTPGMEMAATKALAEGVQINLRTIGKNPGDADG